MKPAEGGIEIGAILAGTYQVSAVLGRGGMGIVYRAQHLVLGEDVAIKVLRDDVALDEETHHRFDREARAAARLRSEHVARVRDVGTLDNSLPYMVMEFLEGADLGQLIDEYGAMHVPVAVDLVLQACDAIVEAHSLGIVHRDIKPNNLFMTARPDRTSIVKVLDFGISKSSTGADLSLTQTSSMLGTPAYMSPEQMRSARHVDARTDVWSLGAVLYELVEARQPFAAESFSEMCVMVAIDPPAPLQLAPELGAVLDRCLAKNPDDRFENVAELMRALVPLAGNSAAARHYVTRAYRVLRLPVPSTIESFPSSEPVSYQTPVPGPGLTLPMNIALAGPTISDLPPGRRRRGLVLGGLVLGAVTAVSIVGIVIVGGTQRAPITSAGAGLDAAVAGSEIGTAGAAAGSDGGSATMAAGAGSSVAAGVAAGAAGSGSSVAAGSGSSATQGSAGASGVGSGSSIVNQTVKPVRPRPVRPKPKPKPDKPKPDNPKPDNPKPDKKCNVFESRTGCK